MNVTHIANSLTEVADKAFPKNEQGGFGYNTEYFTKPVWRNPWKHIVATAEKHRYVSSADILLASKKDCENNIRDFWVKAQISKLSYFAQGDNCLVFEAQTNPEDNAQRMVFRLGTTRDYLGEERVWCPLVVQPHFFKNKDCFTLEHIPFIKSANEVFPCSEDKWDFAQFIQSKIFKDTFYEIRVGKDAGVLPDGTFTYIDAGDVSVITEMKDKVFSHHEKQKIMAQIYENCLGLPQQLQSVVKMPSGDFKTKQEIIFPFAPRHDPTNLLKSDRANRLAQG